MRLLDIWLWQKKGKKILRTVKGEQECSPLLEHKFWTEKSWSRRTNSVIDEDNSIDLNEQHVGFCLS